MATPSKPRRGTRKLPPRPTEGTEDAPRPGAPRAIALKYEVGGADGIMGSSTDAPTVVATGEGAMADFIVKVAEEHGVAVRKDVPLAEALGQLKLGAVIPPELYAAVAEVLAHVYELDQHAEKRRVITRGR